MPCWPVHAGAGALEVEVTPVMIEVGSDFMLELRACRRVGKATSRTNARGDVPTIVRD